MRFPIAMRALGLAVMLASLSSCSEEASSPTSDSPAECLPGEACACEDGVTGTQVCPASPFAPPASCECSSDPAFPDVLEASDADTDSDGNGDTPQPDTLLTDAASETGEDSGSDASDAEEEVLDTPDGSEPTDILEDPDISECTPDCTGKSCGEDGCGDVCGMCDDSNPCTLDECSESQTCTFTERALAPCVSPPCPINGECLYDLDRDSLNGEERIAALSLQGVLAQHRPALWVGKGLADPDHQARLSAQHGVTFAPTTDLWDVMERFADGLEGYLLFDLETDSQSVALSLAGALKGVAITPALEEQAQAAGLSLLLDVRGKDEAWCWENHAASFQTSLLTEQWETTSHAEFLVDYPIAQQAFIYFDQTCGDFRTQLASVMIHPLIFGWGAICSEYEFAKGASLGGASVVASDFSSNLSALSNVADVSLVGNSHADPSASAEEGVHYVAFVMSDGDNIQFIQNSFNHERWWGSEHRGDFPMGWEMSPVLADAAPTLLSWVYESASPLDQMIAGPSGRGYFFPSHHPDPNGAATKSADAMAATDMRIAVVLNDGGGLEAGDAFTAQPEIDGVLYKDFADYNGLNGALRWSNGKPILAMRHLLWNNGANEDSPEGVAASLNAAPVAPFTNIGSYSVVNIHAWSEWSENPFGTGAMDAAKWTIDLLEPHVKVVSPEELLLHLKNHLAGITNPGNNITFEAETDLLHMVGYPEAEGWACSTADPTPGHMCYGPYTTAFGGGSHVADFHLMIDVNAPPAVNDKVATLDVHDPATGTLAVLEVDRFDFNGAMTPQIFSLPFTSSPGSTLEFRVYWHANAYLQVDKIHVY